MKILMENWNNFVNEIRFRPKTPSELGMIVDSLINKFYSGEIENDKLFEELRIYFAAVSKEHEMSVDELIDHLIEKRFSDELSGFLFDPKYREMLKQTDNLKEMNGVQVRQKEKSSRNT